jgi:hypothetical protein
VRKQLPIFITFDLEEFDLPLEYGVQIDEDTQIEISRRGCLALLEVLDKHRISATFFTTANFASKQTEIVKTIAAQHEIASHAYYHSTFSDEDIALSKRVLEEISGKEVVGFRMPRLAQFNQTLLHKAGYKYDSSINPTWLPGRYNHLKALTSVHYKDHLFNIPASVTHFFRIPLFWLTFKNLPLRLYTSMAANSLKRNGHLCLYFHPWEFADLKEYRIPSYIKQHSGAELILKLEQLICELKGIGNIRTIQSYIEEKLQH